jgi:GTP-binding protein
MPAVAKAQADWSTKVKTSDLNTWLRLALERHPPPIVAGFRAKPKYMAQTKARPPTFVLMANRASSLTDSYRRYLVNSIRESFDLPGTPVRLIVRSGANPYAEGGAKSGNAPPKPKGAWAKGSGPKAAGQKVSRPKGPGPKRTAKGSTRPSRPSTRKTAAKPSAGRGRSPPRAPRS